MIIKTVSHRSMYNNFDYSHTNIIINYLKEFFNIKLIEHDSQTKINSDITIHGVWRKDITEDFDLPENTFNILWCYENVNIKNLYKYDIVFSDIRLDIPNLIYIPLHFYYCFDCANSITKRTDAQINKIIENKTDFCCFLISNDYGYKLFSESSFEGCRKRIDFFKYLNNIKKVNSGGMCLNNIDSIVPKDKTLEFIGKHKFMICFENSSKDGYFTEKLFQCYEAGTIPIYWGHHNNYSEVNKLSFIQYTNNLDTANKVLEIDKDDTLYYNMLKESIIKESKYTKDYILEERKDKFKSLIDKLFKNI